VLLVLAACESRDDRLAFDGFFFRTSSSDINDDPAQFVAITRNVSQSFEGARQATFYEATRYCIETFGTSRIRWVIGPDTPPEALSVVDDTLTYQGECNP